MTAAERGGEADEPEIEPMSRVGDIEAVVYRIAKVAVRRDNENLAKGAGGV